jgi:hypothetical protein
MRLSFLPLPSIWNGDYDRTAAAAMAGAASALSPMAGVAMAGRAPVLAPPIRPNAAKPLPSLSSLPAPALSKPHSLQPCASSRDPPLRCPVVLRPDHPRAR